jgi:GNAT superfamily N-acetyltransferase
MRIVVPTRADAPSVIDLLRRQLDEHAIVLSADRLVAAVEAVFADVRRGAFLLAMEDATAIGIAYVSFAWSIEHGGQSARLEELYVVPAQRARGVGALLLRAALERATSAGCNVVDLEVQEGHERAGNLYARHGFARLPRTRWLKHMC